MINPYESPRAEVVYRRRLFLSSPRTRVLALAGVLILMAGGCLFAPMTSPRAFYSQTLDASLILAAIGLTGAILGVAGSRWQSERQPDLDSQVEPAGQAPSEHATLGAPS